MNFFQNTLLVAVAILFFLSCKKDDSPRQKRYLDKIVIEDAKLEAWDLLNGPDMTLFYRDGLVDSISNVGGSDTFENVAPIQLPIIFDDVPFELTDYMDFRVIDVDEFAPDQIMYQIQINPYQMSENGNPFRIWNEDWTIKVHWKTQ